MSPPAPQCFLCRSNKFDTILCKDKWRYLQCCSCGFVQIDPKPDTQEINNLYSSYLPANTTSIEQWRAMMQPVIHNSADSIEKIFKKNRGNVLDVGCGYGFFLQEMHLRGWNVEGIEISETGRRYTTDTFGIKVYAEPIETSGLAENLYDVVTFFYVLEHVADPKSALLAAYRILKPGGLILVRLPHSTPIVKILGPFASRFDLYHTPYHLYDFSPKTIKSLLERCGFADCTTITGGYTPLSAFAARIASSFFGGLGDFLSSISGGKLMLPGISKTTLAVKRVQAADR